MFPPPASLHSIPPLRGHTSRISRTLFVRLVACSSSRKFVAKLRKLSKYTIYPLGADSPNRALGVLVLPAEQRQTVAHRVVRVYLVAPRLPLSRRDNGKKP